MEEIWKPIPGYELFYEASNIGRVRSLTAKRDSIYRNRVYPGRILTQATNKDGYLQVSLGINGRIITITVHQIVAMAFLNHVRCGSKRVIDHIDGDIKNNNLSNLRIVSQRENLSKSNRKSTSKYVGVSWNKRRKKWVARIYVCGTNKEIGFFTDEIEASNAYQNELKKLNESNMSEETKTAEEALKEAGYRIYKPGIDTRQKKFVVCKTGEQHKFESLEKAVKKLLKTDEL